MLPLVQLLLLQLLLLLLLSPFRGERSNGGSRESDILPLMDAVLIRGTVQLVRREGPHMMQETIKTASTSAVVVGQLVEQ